MISSLHYYKIEPILMDRTFKPNYTPEEYFSNTE